MPPSSSLYPALFQPLPLGLGAAQSGIVLRHRVALAPLTRLRNDEAHVPTDLVVQYYEQRSRTPGTLLVTEGVLIAKKAGGFENTPGIYTEEQIKGWKKVVDAVHSNGSYVFLQLWALGRTARLEALLKEGDLDSVAPSPIGLTESTVVPRELTASEIEEYVQMYAQAAFNAVDRAGFDGVEIHGANGYLIDQFLQDVSNHRGDEYGGSIENRSKFAIDIVDAVSSRIGASRTAIRLSPWGKYQDMGMLDPIPQFRYLVQQLKNRHPDLAYIHLFEPTFNFDPVEMNTDSQAGKRSNDFAREIWKKGGGVVVSAGDFDPERALKHAETTGDVIAFGRWFISNPDLPRRIKADIPLTPYDPSTFYTKESPKGYIDYPFAATKESIRLSPVKAGIQASHH